MTPDFVATDRWFANAAGLEGQKCSPPCLLPFRLRKLELVNRIVLSPMHVLAEDGTPNDFHLVHLGSRAVGGAGLLMIEMMNVTREGRITPGCTGMYKPNM